MLFEFFEVISLYFWAVGELSSEIVLYLDLLFVDRLFTFSVLRGEAVGRVSPSSRVTLHLTDQ